MTKVIKFSARQTGKTAKLKLICLKRDVNDDHKITGRFNRPLTSKETQFLKKCIDRWAGISELE